MSETGLIAPYNRPNRQRQDSDRTMYNLLTLGKLGKYNEGLQPVGFNTGRISRASSDLHL